MINTTENKSKLPVTVSQTQTPSFSANIWAKILSHLPSKDRNAFASTSLSFKWLVDNLKAKRITQALLENDSLLSAKKEFEILSRSIFKSLSQKTFDKIYDSQRPTINKLKHKLHVGTNNTTSVVSEGSCVLKTMAPNSIKKFVNKKNVEIAAVYYDGSNYYVSTKQSSLNLHLAAHLKGKLIIDKPDLTVKLDVSDFFIPSLFVRAKSFTLMGQASIHQADIKAEQAAFRGDLTIDKLFVEAKQCVNSAKLINQEFEFQGNLCLNKNHLKSERLLIQSKSYGNIGIVEVSKDAIFNCAERIDECGKFNCAGFAHLSAKQVFIEKQLIANRIEVAGNDLYVQPDATIECEVLSCLGRRIISQQGTIQARHLFLEAQLYASGSKSVTRAVECSLLCPGKANFDGKFTGSVLLINANQGISTKSDSMIVVDKIDIQSKTASLQGNLKIKDSEKMSRVIAGTIHAEGHINSYAPLSFLAKNIQLSGTVTNGKFLMSSSEDVIVSGKIDCVDVIIEGNKKFVLSEEGRISSANVTQITYPVAVIKGQLNSRCDLYVVCPDKFELKASSSIHVFNRCHFESKKISFKQASVNTRSLVAIGKDEIKFKQSSNLHTQNIFLNAPLVTIDNSSLKAEYIQIDGSSLKGNSGTLRSDSIKVIVGVMYSNLIMHGSQIKLEIKGRLDLGQKSVVEASQLVTISALNVHNDGAINTAGSIFIDAKDDVSNYNNGSIKMTSTGHSQENLVSITGNNFWNTGTVYTKSKLVINLNFLFVHGMKSMPTLEQLRKNDYSGSITAHDFILTASSAVALGGVITVEGNFVKNCLVDSLLCVVNASRSTGTCLVHVKTFVQVINPLTYWRIIKPIFEADYRGFVNQFLNAQTMFLALQICVFFLRRLTNRNWARGLNTIQLVTALWGLSRSVRGVFTSFRQLHSRRQRNEELHFRDFISPIASLANVAVDSYHSVQQIRGISVPASVQLSETEKTPEIPQSQEGFIDILKGIPGMFSNDHTRSVFSCGLIGLNMSEKINTETIFDFSTSWYKEIGVNISHKFHRASLHGAMHAHQVNLIGQHLRLGAHVPRGLRVDVDHLRFAKDREYYNAIINARFVDHEAHTRLSGPNTVFRANEHKVVSGLKFAYEGKYVVAKKSYEKDAEIIDLNPKAEKKAEDQTLNEFFGLNQPSTAPQQGNAEEGVGGEPVSEPEIRSEIPNQEEQENPQGQYSPTPALAQLINAPSNKPPTDQALENQFVPASLIPKKTDYINKNEKDTLHDGLDWERKHYENSQEVIFQDGDHKMNVVYLSSKKGIYHQGRTEIIDKAIFEAPRIDTAKNSEFFGPGRLVFRCKEGEWSGKVLVDEFVIERANIPNIEDLVAGRGQYKGIQPQKYFGIRTEEKVFLEKKVAAGDLNYMLKNARSQKEFIEMYEGGREIFNRPFAMSIRSPSIRIGEGKAIAKGLHLNSTETSLQIDGDVDAIKELKLESPKSVFLNSDTYSEKFIVNAEDYIQKGSVKAKRAYVHASNDALFYKSLRTTRYAEVIAEHDVRAISQKITKRHADHHPAHFKKVTLQGGDGTQDGGIGLLLVAGNKVYNEGASIGALGAARVVGFKGVEDKCLTHKFHDRFKSGPPGISKEERYDYTQVSKPEWFSKNDQVIMCSETGDIVTNATHFKTKKGTLIYSFEKDVYLKHQMTSTSKKSTKTILGGVYKEKKKRYDEKSIPTVIENDDEGTSLVDGKFVNNYHIVHRSRGFLFLEGEERKVIPVIEKHTRSKKASGFSLDMFGQRIFGPKKKLFEPDPLVEDAQRLLNSKDPVEAGLNAASMATDGIDAINEMKDKTPLEAASDRVLPVGKNRSVDVGYVNEYSKQEWETLAKSKIDADTLGIKGKKADFTGTDVKAKKGVIEVETMTVGSVPLLAKEKSRSNKGELSWEPSTNKVDGAFSHSHAKGKYTYYEPAVFDVDDIDYTADEVVANGSSDIKHKKARGTIRNVVLDAIPDQSKGHGAYFHGSTKGSVGGGGHHFESTSLRKQPTFFVEEGFNDDTLKVDEFELDAGRVLSDGVIDSSAAVKATDLTTKTKSLSAGAEADLSGLAGDSGDGNLKKFSAHHAQKDVKDIWHPVIHGAKGTKLRGPVSGPGTLVTDSPNGKEEIRNKEHDWKVKAPLPTEGNRKRIEDVAKPVIKETPLEMLYREVGRVLETDDKEKIHDAVSVADLTGRLVYLTDSGANSPLLGDLRIGGTYLDPDTGTKVVVYYDDKNKLSCFAHLGTQSLASLVIDDGSLALRQGLPSVEKPEYDHFMKTELEKSRAMGYQPVGTGHSRAGSQGTHAASIYKIPSIVMDNPGSPSPKADTSKVVSLNSPPNLVNSGMDLDKGSVVHLPMTLKDRLALSAIQGLNQIPVLQIPSALAHLKFIHDADNISERIKSLQETAKDYGCNVHSSQSNPNSFFDSVLHQMQTKGHHSTYDTNQLKLAMDQHMIMHNRQHYEQQRSAIPNRAMMQATSEAMKMTIAILNVDGTPPVVFKPTESIAILYLGCENGVYHSLIPTNKLSPLQLSELTIGESKQ